MGLKKILKISDGNANINDTNDNFDTQIQYKHTNYLFDTHIQYKQYKSSF